MATRETDIYIRVSGEGGPSWRPVRAVQVGEDVYRIVGANPAPGREDWLFATGDLVRCKPYELTDQDIVLVAFEKAAGVS